ncbi:hypothetical protein PIECOFPK_02343 [Mycovorax composti]|jgi:hypothetical protein|uniref:Uncharacterized protein n=5 Tax=Bacteroidota TaxID=976 RepID=A0A0G3LZV5_CHRGL|nr:MULTISPECIES: hypothetical protein [Flavobacteriales]AKK71915.1 hypothetical protein OK18_04020 [Chryseobacterium gallinarum]MDV3970700.1 hypothetical protein [Elizabethkingia anophelis]MDX8574572.1 hypothetical protein [Elizabethkingia sp. HX WYD]SEH58920.1 hypothetical protein SAMN02927937_00345 [Paenimyroides aquimaris]DAC74656.1 TPA_exp: FIG01092846: hypothetical protein [Elizabethkingia anophelis]
MKQLLDLSTFAKTLTDKGYDGYFQTEGAYPDKIKDSISQFLEACKNGTDKPLRPDSFSLRTYIEWNGDDKPKVDCYMRVRYEDGKFDVQKMDITRKDQYGHLMKKSELTNLSTGTVPTRKEAIALVSEPPKQKLSSQVRRLRM